MSGAVPTPIGRNAPNEPPRDAAVVSERPQSKGAFISVLVTAHQRRAFILDATRSAKRQTLPANEYEIVVVKDFDDPEIDRTLLELGARVVRHRSDSIGEIMTTGIRSCDGDIVCFLDDDDVFDPRKLAAVKDAFSQDGGCGYFHNGLALIDETGRPIDGQATRTGRRPSEMSADWGFCSSCISVRKEVLGQVLARWPEVTRSPDTFLDYVSRALPYERRQTLEPLTQYRIHQGSNSAKTNHAAAYLTTTSIVRSLPPSRARSAAISSLLGRYMSAAIRGRSTDRRSVVWALTQLALCAAPAEIRPNAREVLCGALIPLSPGAARTLYSLMRKGKVDWLPTA